MKRAMPALMLGILACSLWVGWFYYHSNFEKSREAKFEPNPPARSFTRRPARQSGLDRQSSEYEKLMKILHGDNKATARLEAGEFCRSKILSSGNYRYVFTLIEQMNADQIFEVLLPIIGVSSPLGLETDITNQLALINVVDEQKFIILKRQLYKRIALDVNWATNPEYIDLIPNSDLKLLSEQEALNFKKDFFILGDMIAKRLGDYEHVREGVNILLQQNSIKTSAMIGELESGEARDNSVSELVEWLVKNGHIGDAKQWANTITDPNIRSHSISLVTKQ